MAFSSGGVRGLLHAIERQCRGTVDGREGPRRAAVQVPGEQVEQQDKRQPLARVERIWRGVVMDTYALEKLTGWTPELSPAPDSPLFRWRVLAGDFLSHHKPS